MTQRFLGALQFLTVWPVHGKTAPPGESAIFFPLIGALLGASAGGIMFLCSHVFTKPLAAMLAIAWLIAVTGCLHEDGLADVADAIRSGRTREKMMLILKDSRIGTYGSVVLIVSILLRWQALAQCRINPFYVLTAVVVLSRATLVVLAATTTPAGDGLGRAFHSGISRWALSANVAQSLAIGFLIGWRNAIALLFASGMVILLARRWFSQRLGGVNGDCLGAACQTAETINLLILAWQPSF